VEPQEGEPVDLPALGRSRRPVVAPRLDRIDDFVKSAEIWDGRSGMLSSHSAERLRR
jgi:hypothetical protein